MVPANILYEEPNAVKQAVCSLISALRFIRLRRTEVNSSKDSQFKPINTKFYRIRDALSAFFQCAH